MKKISVFLMIVASGMAIPMMASHKHKGSTAGGGSQTQTKPQRPLFRDPATATSSSSSSANPYLMQPSSNTPPVRVVMQAQQQQSSRSSVSLSTSDMPTTMPSTTAAKKKQPSLPTIQELPLRSLVMENAQSSSSTFSVATSAMPVPNLNAPINPVEKKRDAAEIAAQKLEAEEASSPSAVDVLMNTITGGLSTVQNAVTSVSSAASTASTGLKYGSKAMDYVPYAIPLMICKQLWPGKDCNLRTLRIISALIASGYSAHQIYKYLERMRTFQVMAQTVQQLNQKSDYHTEQLNALKQGQDDLSKQVNQGFEEQVQAREQQTTDLQKHTTNTVNAATAPLAMQLTKLDQRVTTGFNAQDAARAAQTDTLKQHTTDALKKQSEIDAKIRAAEQAAALEQFNASMNAAFKEKADQDARDMANLQQFFSGKLDEAMKQQTATVSQVVKAHNTHMGSSLAAKISEKIQQTTGSSNPDTMKFFMQMFLLSKQTQQKR